MKIVRCNFASQLNNGQRATSLLATNTTGASADITQISSQDTWLDRISAGVAVDRTPTSRIPTPISAQSTRWYRCGMIRCSRRSNARPINWNGSSTSVSARKANAMRTTRVMNAGATEQEAIARRGYAQRNQ